MTAKLFAQALLAIPVYRKCKKCATTHPIQDYPLDKWIKGGISRICAACVIIRNAHKAATTAEYRKNNRLTVNAYHRVYAARQRARARAVPEPEPAVVPEPEPAVVPEPER